MAYLWIIDTPEQHQVTWTPQGDTAGHTVRVSYKIWDHEVDDPETVVWTVAESGIDPALGSWTKIFSRTLFVPPYGATEAMYPYGFQYRVELLDGSSAVVATLYTEQVLTYRAIADG